MDSLEFKKCLNGILKQYGFKRTGKNWGIEKDGLLTVVTISKSSYCNGWHVMCGAKVTNEKHSKYPEANVLDTYDMFLFPADPSYRTDAYKEALHVIPHGGPGHHWIVRQYIDLDLFSDEIVIEALQHNIEKRMLPMLNIDTLKQLLLSDDYYVARSWKPENLLQYGVSEARLIQHNCRYRKNRD